MPGFTKEQYQTLPEDFKAEYQLVDGEYKHAGVVKMKGTLNALNSSSEATATQLSQLQASQQTAIDAARQEAYDTAVKDNKLEDVQSILNQKIEDAEKRANESEVSFKNRLQVLADKQALAVSADLSSIATEAGAIAFKSLVKGMVKVDPETGAETFFDENGSATSLDRAGFGEYLKKSQTFAPLVKADVATNGGGLATGSNSVSDHKKPEDYTEQERVDLYRLNPAKFNELFKKT